MRAVLWVGPPLFCRGVKERGDGTIARLLFERATGEAKA
jgi:hypothetical protein